MKKLLLVLLVYMMSSLFVSCGTIVDESGTPAPTELVEEISLGEDGLPVGHPFTLNPDDVIVEVRMYDAQTGIETEICCDYNVIIEVRVSYPEKWERFDEFGSHRLGSVALYGGAFSRGTGDIKAKVFRQPDEGEFTANFQPGLTVWEGEFVGSITVDVPLHYRLKIESIRIPYQDMQPQD